MTSVGTPNRNRPSTDNSAMSTPLNRLESLNGTSSKMCESLSDDAMGRL